MVDNVNGDVIIYQTDDGLTKIDVRVENETVWLSQQQMAELFGTSRTNIIEHINNIYAEEELDKELTCQNFRQVRKEGNRNVTREIPFYNLDMIISLGYRIKSKIATNFRRWATERLKEYMIKGFTMDDERLKGNGGGNYWKELLARIKDIRSSEKVLYRQVLDLYATAVDYDPKDSKSMEFFKIVQNKLHYATHGHTASEVIYERADAEKPFMGLTTFKGDIPVLQDVVIAKNYLNEEELKVLNNLVSGYFDFAEIQAIRHNPMYMEDYIKQLDIILSSAGGKMLIGAGSVSHNQAIKKAKSEYKKYQVKTISPVEEEYFKSLKEINSKIAKKDKKQAILNNELREEDMLPSVRVMANDLKISFLTVKKAYDELEKEGYIKSVQGKGSFVAPKNSELVQEKKRKEIQNYIEKIIKLAQMSDISEKEIIELFKLMYKGEI